MNKVLSIVDKLQICTGIPISDLSYLDWDMDNNTCFQEYVSNIADENSGSKVVRYKKCNQILGWFSCVSYCRACQIKIRRNRKQENTKEEENVIPNEEDQEDMSKILNRVFPNATADMKCLLESQRKVFNCKDRKGMKWDKRILSMCLSLWVRSPKNYQDIRDSNMLILPSGRQLRKYRNKVNLEPRLNDEVLNWMYMAAKENQLEEHGYAGGLVHDETKIQEGIALDMSSGFPKLIGWIDTGEENLHAKILKEKTMKSTLATHVLQVMFVGYTGYRFPVCHYPTCGVKASELHTILWSTIKKLHDWGFLVDYIMQDGGEENRQFMKSNFDGDELEWHYLSPNLVDPTCVVAHIQDFSHNMKKLRNSILSSGYKPFHKRLVQKNDLYIIWEHWISAVKWDREVNTRPLCHKITDQHLYPNSSEKMRNLLAEDMLNEDFLYLMEAFLSDLNDGSHLNSSIQLLKHTSRIISVFRDLRPVTSLSDCRIKILKDAFDWFQDWKKEIAQLKTTGVNTAKKLISPKCLEDIENMLLTFKEILGYTFEQVPPWVCCTFKN